ncbi:MAG: site-specific integrase [Dermatophilus congolensis]|nr:site-specific integrase [Dermatophilus congolensis]
MAAGHRAATRSVLDAGRDGRNQTREVAGVAPAPRPTFGDALPAALALGRLRWSPGSAARFEGVAANYLGRWEVWSFDEINRSAVLDWMTEMHTNHVGPSTQVKALAVFRATWIEAQRSGLTDAPDPSVGVSVRKAAWRMGRTLSTDELARLVATTGDNDALRAQFLFGGVLGLRWGEIAALNVGDLDLGNGLVHVRTSLARGQGTYVVKAPKSTAGARAVALPLALRPLLGRISRGRQGPLFTTASGQRLNYHSSRRALIKASDAASVPDCTGWHVLRRTAATLALQGGMTLKDVQSLLGHSHPSQTLTAYVAARDALALAPTLDDLARRAVGDATAGVRVPPPPSTTHKET